MVILSSFIGHSFCDQLVWVSFGQDFVVVSSVLDSKHDVAWVGLDSGGILLSWTQNTTLCVGSG